MDVFTATKRRQIMAQIKGRDTKPEKLVRSTLHKMGFRFRLCRRQLPGKPDIVLAKHKAVIFVHGCFWHHHKHCKRAALPQTNREFWTNKIKKNASRDEAVKRKLRRMGWRVLTIWQCQTKDLERLTGKIDTFIKR